MSNTDLTAQGLRDILGYDPNTGQFMWRVRRGNVIAGSAAGSLGQDGYTYIRVNRRLYGAHRLAWLHFYGVWPTEVDHKNQSRSDNRIANLREVTRSQNQQNKSFQRNNTSGLKGASWHKVTGRWRAQIRLNGKNHYLGVFDTAEAAHSVYMAAVKAMHTHHPATA